MIKKMVLWSAGGILLVALSFFIPAQEGSIWPSVIAGGVASLAYLTALFVHAFRKIDSSGKRKLITGVLLLLVVFSIASAAISYEGTRRQTALLPEIRHTIEKGIAENYVKKHLLTTMRAYYTGDRFDEDTGLGTIFRAKNDSLITEENLLLYNGEDTYKDEEEDLTLRIFVKTIDPDSIVLVAESEYMDGKDQEYENYSGATGKYQVIGTLTKEGVRYERAN
ncbi:MAG: hypothetical protein R3222_01235 [Balneolaceae bacterium]|nr:hypothetical protein [Balneolaceae bacterium]